MTETQIVASRFDTPRQRMEENTIPVPESGCWLWLGTVNNMGYGQISISCKRHLTHRLNWELYKGPIPKGLFVLHKCDTPRCCNPDHLFLGGNDDNVADMLRKGRQNKRKTHCKHGHELVPDNVITRKDNGQRQCKKCHYLAAHAYQKRKAVEWRAKWTQQ